MSKTNMSSKQFDEIIDLDAFQRALAKIAKEHGFDANDYITNKPYQKFTWGNK